MLALTHTNAAISALLFHSGGAPATPAELLHHWTTAPSVVVPIALTALLYPMGLVSLWRRVGVGRGVQRWRAGAFGAGVLALIVAVVSPLDTAADVLFSAHMIQHLLLVLVAAPLLVAGAPERAMPWSIPLSGRRRVGRALHALRPLGPLAHPMPAVMIASGGLWVWHVPALYDLAVRNHTVHGLEHATFLLTAVLFWWSVLHVRTLRADAANGVRLLGVFAMAVQGSLLGALIAFASRPLYESHLEIPEAWGLTPLEDQQLAGLVMWVPPSAIYIGVAAFLFLGWMRSVPGAGGQPQGVAVSPGRSRGYAANPRSGDI